MSTLSRALQVLSYATLILSILIGLLLSGAIGKMGFWRYLARGPMYPSFVGGVPATLSPAERAAAFKFSDIPSLDGKVSLVTGSNAGLGYWTAYHLAANGSTVVMACRTMTKCNDAAGTIRAAFPRAVLHTLELDTTSLKSVHSFQKAFKSKFNRLDILVLNAGFVALGAKRVKLTVDGFEETFAANHLGHFKLYNDLEDLIINTAKNYNVVATVTAVSSAASYDAKSLPNSLEEINDEKKPFDAMGTYGVSKLMNILFAKEVADRLKDRHISDVVANAAHPGGVATPGFQKFEEVVKGGTFGFILAPMFRKLTQEFVWSAEDGALTQLFCAASKNVTEGRISGKYFHPIAYEVTPSALVTKENQVNLWKLSSELVKSKGY